MNPQQTPSSSSLSSNTLPSPPMDDPNGGVLQRPATRTTTATESLKGFWERINCCNDDPSNPCRPRSIHQSGYWLLIAMVLCALVMVLPFLKGLLHLIGACTNLVLFACIFVWRTPASIGVFAAAAVVLANALFGAAMYGQYASRFNDNCDVLLVVGLRSSSNDKFCFEDSFPIISLVCGLAWLMIGGCLLRFVELRRAELLAGNTSANAGSSSTSGIAATARPAPPRPQPPLQEPIPLHSIINRRLPRHSNGGGMA